MNSISRSHREGSVVLDLSLALSLLVALGIVFGIDRMNEKSTIPNPDTTGAGELPVIEHRPGEQQSASRPMRLGVTPRRNYPDVQVYDDIGRLLESLGEGYKQYTSFDPNDLRDINKLAEYSVIFLTCSTAPDEWLDRSQPKSEGDRPGTRAFSINQQAFIEMRQAIREWVEQGGTLYVSDKHFIIVANAFPEFIDRAAVDSVGPQEIEAEVVDPGLREILGATIVLRFDMPGWRPAAFQHEKLITYLRGRYRTEEGGERKLAPLLVKFPVKDGNVIFTSFHNEKQNSETETQLLRYLVFAAVTAKVESQIEKTMSFAPQKRSLLSSTPENPAVTQTYRKDKPGDVQIALGFGNEGAILRLMILAPNGKQYSKELISSTVVEIRESAAPTGDWHISVEAIKVPFANYPFTVSIGQK